MLTIRNKYIFIVSQLSKDAYHYVKVRKRISKLFAIIVNDT